MEATAFENYLPEVSNITLPGAILKWFKVLGLNATADNKSSGKYKFDTSQKTWSETG